MDKPIETVPGGWNVQRKLNDSAEELNEEIEVKFESLIRSPTLEKKVETFSDIVDRLKTAKKVWDDNIQQHEDSVRDQNPAFRKFDRATAGEDGATLDLLTEDVLKYLEENELMDAYRINRYE